MFSQASSFNQDISRKLVNNGIAYTAWDVSDVTDMSAMFYQALNFNQNIGNWDVSDVTNMSTMFMEASSFNQDISGWDVSNVTNMTSMFNGASNFNQHIRIWDTSVEINGFDNMFISSTQMSNTYNTTPGFGTTPTSTFFNQTPNLIDDSNIQSRVDNISGGSGKQTVHNDHGHISAKGCFQCNKYEIFI